LADKQSTGRDAMPLPIIIDTDPGTDDAVAILLALAAPDIEVLGLVAVAGNLPLA
jgi:purine nucleosidase